MAFNYIPYWNSLLKVQHWKHAVHSDFMKLNLINIVQVCNLLYTCIIQKHQCTLILNLNSVYNLTICTIVTCFNYQKMKNLKSGLDHSEILLSSEKHILDNSFTLKKIYGKLYKSCPIYQERCFTAFLKLLWRKTQFCFCTPANTCKVQVGCLPGLREGEFSFCPDFCKARPMNPFWYHKRFHAI